MRLYPKKLVGIQDLEQEKKRLLKKAKELDKEDFLSFGKSGGKKKSTEQSEKSSSLLDLLPIDNPIISLLLPLIEKRFFAYFDGTRKAEKKQSYTGKPKKNIAFNIAIEFIGGYLKWKAIELSYKGIKRLIRNRKEKAEKNLAETAILSPTPRK